jgi:hypothetical protein
MRENLEYWLVVAVARTLGRMPRAMARLLADVIAFAVCAGWACAISKWRCRRFQTKSGRGF